MATLYRVTKYVLMRGVETVPNAGFIAVRSTSGGGSRFATLTDAEFAAIAAVLQSGKKVYTDLGNTVVSTLKTSPNASPQPPNPLPEGLVKDYSLTWIYTQNGSIGLTVKTQGGPVAFTLDVANGAEFANLAAALKSGIRVYLRRSQIPLLGANIPVLTTSKDDPDVP